MSMRMRVSQIEVRGLAALAAPIVEVANFAGFEDSEEREAEAAARRASAEQAFRAELVGRLRDAFTAGAETAVSTEARRAVAVRGYVLLGVVAAVVSMPLIGMLFKLDPQAFGAYIAPITGIAGTIVGYWFGTVGQGATGQGISQPQAQPSIQPQAQPIQPERAETPMSPGDW
jgi:hypothetical protein